MSAVKERPILFDDLSVRAILAGRKTQTRRVVKLPEGQWDSILGGADIGDNSGVWQIESPRLKYGRVVDSVSCAFGVVGDRLWVRECWADVNTGEGPAICYRSDGHIVTWHEFSTSFGPNYGAGPSMDYDAYPGSYSMWWEDLLNGEPEHDWRPSSHMPRWASRITLEITGIRVERLQDIRPCDVQAEGCPYTYSGFDPDDAPDWNGWFRGVWDEIYAKRPGCSWESNPFVWMVEFKRVQP